ncbi:MAG: ferritin-like domain-containing protein [Ilumatobacteraceae bacterium]
MDITANGESRTAGRRRLLSAVGLGSALSALPVVARAAGAAGSARPRAATPSDEIASLRLAQQLELSALALYEQAAEGLGGEPVVVAQLIDVLVLHHRAYADSLAGALGSSLIDLQEVPLAEQLNPADSAAVVATAIEVEGRLAATHLGLVGTVTDVGHAKLLASIATVEARHVAALTAISGGDPMPTDAAFSAAEAYSAADFAGAE